MELLGLASSGLLAWEMEDWAVFFSLFRTRRISRKWFQIVERRCAVLAASVHSCTKVSH
jgi:hypothetical protein